MKLAIVENYKKNKMKHGGSAEDFRVDGYMTLTNSGGIEIELDNRGDGLRYRFNNNGTYTEPEETFIGFDDEGEAMFMDGDTVYHLSQFMRAYAKGCMMEEGGSADEYGKGGNITAVEKRVTEVNELIEMGKKNNVSVTDTGNTWQSPMKYKPFIYKNGVLYEEYDELDLYLYAKTGERKWRIEKNKYTKVGDGVDTQKQVLSHVFKMYRKELKYYADYDYYMLSSKSKMMSGGMLENKIDNLYKKSKFINDDFNWKLKLLEMLQDNSLEAYDIYQTLSEEEKEQVLHEQYEVDTDMGSDGDGKIETTKQNIRILLRGAKNGKKYAKGSTVEGGGRIYFVVAELKGENGQYAFNNTFYETEQEAINVMNNIIESKSIISKNLPNYVLFDTIKVISEPSYFRILYADGGGVRKEMENQKNIKIKQAIKDIVTYSTLPPQIDYVRPYLIKYHKAEEYLRSLPYGEKYIDIANKQIDAYYSETGAGQYDSLFAKGGGVNDIKYAKLKSFIENKKYKEAVDYYLYHANITSDFVGSDVWAKLKKENNFKEFEKSYNNDDRVGMHHDSYAKGGGVDDIKSIAKQLKFPPATRSSSDSIMWNKKGGHAGDKVVYRVMENAEKLGWTRTFKQSTHPAYDIVSNQNVLFDPTGKYKIKGYQRYGNTSYDNWYQLDLTAVINTDDQEAKGEINSFKEKMKSYKKGGPTKAQSKKVGKVMHEWKAGKLHSGSKKGPIVKDQKQAVAIALSEAGISKKETGGELTGWKHKRKK